MTIGNIFDYQHYEIDVDGSQYLKTNRDVELFRVESQAIQVILDNFSHELEQRLYIKGNYLFFTLDGRKYWYNVSCSSHEWETIDQLIKQLEAKADNIAYNFGRLD